MCSGIEQEPAQKVKEERRTLCALEWVQNLIIVPILSCVMWQGLGGDCNGGRTGEDNHIFLEPASILCRCNGTGIGRMCHESLEWART